MKGVVFSSPRHQKWAKLISQFLSGQIIIQLLNFATGFLLLRWLSVTAYAQFSVAFAFQSTLGMLIDVGFSGSIIALVGDRGEDEHVVGNYIRSARHFRNRTFAVIIVAAAVAFPLIVHGQHWDIKTQFLLFGAIVSSLFFQGFGMYAAPLLIHHRLKPYYRAQIASAAGRVFLCTLLHLGGALTAWAASWVASLALAVTGLLYRKDAQAVIQEPRQSDTQFNSDMLRYLAPLMPGVVFTAFQGQISVALITIFGHTRSIAEVAALGRLGQLFFILAAFNSVIVEPYIAKVNINDLLKRYLLMAFSAASLAVVVSVIAFRFPEPLLWLLGSKYGNLQAEVGWLVATSCVSYVAGVLWVMNSARRWLFWWYTNMYIACVMITQVICVSTMQLTTTHSVILLSLITAVVVLCTHIVGGACGLIKNHPPMTTIGTVVETT